MAKRNIIVIGASAGGFQGIKTIVAGLPKDLDASVFIVWHMSPNARGILPQVLTRFGTLPAAHAIDNEPINQGRVYIAPPDHHLIIENGKVRVTRGPKENMFRPAIDPLFRSAAYVYKEKVIGVILSGALDDGTAGLWLIKQRGGLAVVQDPEEAEVASMPENAIKAVAVDHVVPVEEIAYLLVKLCSEPVIESSDIDMADNDKIRNEINIAIDDDAYRQHLFQIGQLTPYTCPECHGVLSSIEEGGRSRFRCHTGHAFTADSLLASVSESIEESFWSAIRGVQEAVFLLNHMGDHFAEINQPKLAATFFKKAQDADQRAQSVRKAVFEHERLSVESIRQQTESNGGTQPVHEETAENQQ